MRIRDTGVEEEASLNMTPLIDMVFLLLIFFLVATTFAQEERELDIQLPGTATIQPLSAPPQQVIVNIAPDGSLKVTGQDYTMADLSALLSRVVKDEPNREVLIRCDEKAFHRYFAAVANLCRASGIGELKIGYVLEPPKGVEGQP